MKFFKSLLTIATILAAASAQVTWDDTDSVSLMVTQSFAYDFTKYYFPSTSGWSDAFDYQAQQMISQFSSDMANDAQKAGLAYLRDVKDFYRYVYHSADDNVNNWKAWVYGNYSQYSDSFVTLSNAYIDAAKFAVSSIEGQAGCGPQDAQDAKNTIMGPCYNIISEITYATSGYDSFRTFANANVISDVYVFLTKCMNDVDPVGYMKQMEAILFNPRLAMTNAQVANMGSYMISLITHKLDSTVAELQAATANIPTLTASIQCTGN